MASIGVQGDVRLIKAASGHCHESPKPFLWHCSVAHPVTSSQEMEVCITSSESADVADIKTFLSKYPLGSWIHRRIWKIRSFWIWGICQLEMIHENTCTERTYVRKRMHTWTFVQFFFCTVSNENQTNIYPVVQAKNTHKNKCAGNVSKQM